MQAVAGMPHGSDSVQPPASSLDATITSRIQRCVQLVDSASTAASSSTPGSDTATASGGAGIMRRLVDMPEVIVWRAMLDSGVATILQEQDSATATACAVAMQLLPAAVRALIRNAVDYDLADVWRVPASSAAVATPLRDLVLASISLMDAPSASPEDTRRAIAALYRERLGTVEHSLAAIVQCGRLHVLREAESHLPTVARPNAAAVFADSAASASARILAWATVPSTGPAYVEEWPRLCALAWTANVAAALSQAAGAELPVAVIDSAVRLAARHWMAWADAPAGDSAVEAPLPVLAVEVDALSPEAPALRRLCKQRRAAIWECSARLAQAADAGTDASKSVARESLADQVHLLSAAPWPWLASDDGGDGDDAEPTATTASQLWYARAYATVRLASSDHVT
jgi:hypothetical protein